MKALLYKSELIDQYLAEFSRAKRFHLAMAMVTEKGIKEIESELHKCLERGGRGEILFGVDLPTEPDAIESLRKLQLDFDSQLELRVFKPAVKRTFHPKMAIFLSGDRKHSAILGSSNLTHGGLKCNFEANVLIDDANTVGTLLEYFSENFDGGHSKEVDDEWLVRYRAIWKRRIKAKKLLEQIRHKVRAIGSRNPGKNPPPERIAGHAFCFTGGIEDWPRESRLYPTIKKLGGRIVKSADRIDGSVCLVHGDILKKETRKLTAAKGKPSPVISEDEFLKILDCEMQSRKATGDDGVDADRRARRTI